MHPPQRRDSGRAKAVPLPAVAAFVVLTLGLFAPLPGGGAGRDAVQVLQQALIALLAVPLWRRAARLLGHSQISMTMHDTHAVPELATGAAVRMTTALWGDPKAATREDGT